LIGTLEQKKIMEFFEEEMIIFDWKLMKYEMRSIRIEFANC